MKKTFTNRLLNNKILRLNYLFALIILFVILSISCKKKSLSPLPPFIEIGNSAKMEIHTIDSNISAPWPFSLGIPGEFDFDVNNDGENDLRFSINYSYSVGGGAHGHQYLKLLNNRISLAGNPFEDTVFIKFDTTILNFGLGNLFWV